MQEKLIKLLMRFFLVTVGLSGKMTRMDLEKAPTVAYNDFMKGVWCI